MRPLDQVLIDCKRHSRMVKGYVQGTRVCEWSCECEECEKLAVELKEHAFQLCCVINKAHDDGLDSMKIPERKLLLKVHDLQNARDAYQESKPKQPAKPKPVVNEYSDLPLFARGGER